MVYASFYWKVFILTQKPKGHSPAHVLKKWQKKLQKPSNLSNTISPEATPSESFITHLPLSTVLLAQYCLLDWSLRFSRVSPVSQPASQSGLPPAHQPPARLSWQPRSHHFNRAAKSLLNASDTHSEYGISLFFYYRQISHSLCMHKSSHSVSLSTLEPHSFGLSALI